jgi:hypothetical protein
MCLFGGRLFDSPFAQNAIKGISVGFGKHSASKKWKSFLNLLPSFVM